MPSDLPTADGAGSQIGQDERLSRLSRLISTRTLEGFSVVDRNEREVSAVLVKPGKPVNHVLHAVVSIFTCGLWAIVWIVLSMTQRRELRVRVGIDPYGNLLEERVNPS